MSLFDFFRPKRSDLPPLQLYNTLSGKSEVFTPLSSGKVLLYNCGPTTYDVQHIGNLFPPVIANTLRRVLEAWGYKVKEVNNITDFGHISEDEASEDKMTKGLRREGKALTLANMRALSEKYVALFHEDLPLLGIDRSKVLYPRASDYIAEQIAIIKTLEQKGYAYKTSDGIYFDTAKYPSYGKLGNINLSGLKEGARVEENVEKRGPYDFALWKFDKKLGWKSPWGLGFPGWHTECIAMIFKLLGKQIDVHMGGVDLIPTHHNNEIAQAESVSGKQFVKQWVHNAHITVEGKKISKSIGNTIYLHNIVDRGLNPRALRYWFLTGHYRTPMNFTWETLEGADQALKRLMRMYLELQTQKENNFLTPQRDSEGSSEKEKNYSLEVFKKDFYSALADDLNTPQALAALWELVKNDTLSREDKFVGMKLADKILGLGFNEKQRVVKIAVVEKTDLPEDLQTKLKERENARAAKDFARADQLRQEIEAAGYEIKDTSEGSEIIRK